LEKYENFVMALFLVEHKTERQLAKKKNLYLALSLMVKTSKPAMPHM
jgi:hypothetical protein